MADEVAPRTGELTTANYGWTKPTVGASADAWGGYINADLDGIDSTVHSIQTSVPAASSTTPAMDGTAAVGTGTTFARADHVHPTDTSRAPLISPVFTGTPTAPTAAPGTNTTQIATTAFVEALPAAMNDNRLINGDMRINQRGATSGTAASVYTVDRWAYYATQTNKGTWSQVTASSAGIAATGFGYQLQFVSSSAYTPLATDNFGFWQAIEADFIADFAFGTAGAKPVTLSFWVNCSLTGTFSGALQNYAETRSYPFAYTIPTANTWTKIAVTIPGDTAGTWVLQGAGGGMYVIFDLGSGANFHGPAGAWATTTPTTAYQGATGAVNIVATNGATFGVTGIKLEVGSAATPYNRQSLAKSMADCQRYYSVVDAWMFVYGTASNSFGQTITLPVTMRASPTIAFTGVTYVNASGITLGNASSVAPGVYATATTTAGASFTAKMTASAEL
jgi:hypothetical protein